MPDADPWPPFTHVHTYSFIHVHTGAHTTTQQQWEGSEKKKEKRKRVLPLKTPSLVTSSKNPQFVQSYSTGNSHFLSLHNSESNTQNPTSSFIILAVPLTVFFFNYYSETESHYIVLAGLKLTTSATLAQNSERSTWLCLSHAGITGAIIPGFF